MIYLDNCATTKQRDEVAKSVFEYQANNFANPSSLHSLGMRVQKDIESARREIAEILNVSEDELYFTASGTEANNIALNGVMEKFGKRKKHILVSSVEHSSVWEKMKDFSKKGYEVETLSVDKFACVNPEDLKNKLREDTALVSCMQVNNEIGTIEPIEELGEIIAEKSEAVFHVDGVQGFLKVPLFLKKSRIKLYSASGHKIHAPKGVGLLFVDKSLSITPLFYGGGQERGLRSGTENTCGIFGLGLASKLMAENFEAERERAFKLKDMLWKKLSEIPFVTKLSPDKSSPYILSIAFKDVPGEVLLHYLERDEIFISTSSACNSNGNKKSRTVSAINLSENYSKGVIRMCVSYETSPEDIEKAASKIKYYVEKIREVVQ